MAEGSRCEEKKRVRSSFVQYLLDFSLHLPMFFLLLFCIVFGKGSRVGRVGRVGEVGGVGRGS